MTPLPYGHQTIEGDDVRAVAEAMVADKLTTGPLVERFEHALAERCGVSFAVVVSSGTAALQTAYAAAGVGPGTEVVTTPLTFAATANAAVLLGATPVFADVDPLTLCLSPQAAKAKLTSRTRVVAPVDYAGEPADLRAFRALCRANGLLLVEDACHALGATLDGKRVGQLADLTVLSFHPVKHVTTGEGGAVLTDDPHLAQRARDYRNHGIVHAPERRKADEGEWFYDIASIGQNFRLTDVQCALGLSQLSKLDRFLARRRQIARHYRAALADEHRIQLPFARDDDAHAWHLFPIRLSGEVPPRREVFERLRAQGILVQVHYVPVNSMHAYRALGHLPEQTPCALDAYRRLLSLPIFPSLRDEDVERVVLALREALP